MDLYFSNDTFTSAPDSSNFTSSSSLLYGGPKMSKSAVHFEKWFPNQMYHGYMATEGLGGTVPTPSIAIAHP